MHALDMLLLIIMPYMHALMLILCTFIGSQTLVFSSGHILSREPQNV